MQHEAIITFNISGLPFPPAARARVREFARRAEGTGATIINLQEVHTYGLLWLLKSHLPSFPYITYRPGIVGPRAGLVTASRRPVRSTYCPVGRHRGVLVGRLDSGVVVMNTHLTANTDGDWTRNNRFYPTHKQQLDQLLDLSASYGNDAGVILTGDFNVAKSCDLYGYFVKSGGWEDAFRDNMEPTFHAGFLPPGRTPQCIDYIFAKGGVIGFGKSSQVFKDKAALGAGRESYLSNHIGLYAELKM